MSVKKVLSIIMIVMLLVVVFTDKPALATAINITSIDAGNSTGNQVGKGNAITITASNSANDTSNVSNTGAPIVNNAATESAILNNTTNNATNNKVNNTSKNATGLPYTGTSSSIVFVIIALLVSAIYAFKKVRDYNV